MAAPGVLMGAQDAAEGRLLEGGVTAGGSALSAAGGMGIASRVRGPKGALLGLGVTALGTLTSAGLGEQAERVKAGMTGQEIAGRKDLILPAGEGPGKIERWIWNPRSRRWI